MRYFLLLFLLFSGFSSAYTFRLEAYGDTYPSATAACDGFKSKQVIQQQYPSSAVLSGGPINYACDVRYFNSGMSQIASSAITRTGQSCPSNGTFDPLLGVCNSPPALDGTVCFDDAIPPPRVIQNGICTNLASSTPQTQCKYFAGTGNVQTRTFWVYEGSGDSTDLTVQNLQDKTGCEIAPTSDIKPEADCKYFPPTPAVPYFVEGVLSPGVSQPGTYRCKASSALTGNYIAPSNSSGLKPADTICADPGSPACSLPDLNKSEQKPCTYTTDSKGNQVCTSSKFEATQGKTKCGFVGSEFKCSEDLKKATGAGLSIATKVETKTQPDGKIKEVKTDVQTATNCKGTDCTTKTTTTTTTTIKSSGGATESVSGTCTGDNCPDKNTNPDGDGDGFGDCTGSDCGEGEGGGKNDWYTPGEDTYSSVIQDFATAVSGIPVVAGVDNFLTFTPSGACPVYTADVWVFSVRLDQWCSDSTIPWDLIKAIILGCCAFLAFRIAFT
jgi:hypothetical protein